MSGRVIGVGLMVVGVGILALAAVDLLGWGIGLDGNTPALAVGAVLIGLGWMKFGGKARADRPASISDNDRHGR